MKVEIEDDELVLLCEMAKNYIDAMGDEIEEQDAERFPGKRRENDQRFLQLHIVWERAISAVEDARKKQ